MTRPSYFREISEYTKYKDILGTIRYHCFCYVRYYMILSQISVLIGLLRQRKILLVHPIDEGYLLKRNQYFTLDVAFPLRPTSSSFLKVMQKRQAALVTVEVVASRAFMMSPNCC